MGITRDRRGRFCKADDQTPDLPLAAKAIGYAPGYDLLATAAPQPPHSTIRAYQIEECTPGGSQVCYPYPNSPDMPLYLHTFSEAKQMVMNDNIDTELRECQRMAEDGQALADTHDYDFTEPVNYTDAKFPLGAEVYVVDTYRTFSASVSAFKGIIIGASFEYEKNQRYGSHPGWNYEIYFKRPASDIDIEHGIAAGTIVETSLWVQESMLYMDFDEALDRFLREAHKIMVAYQKIHKRIMRLKQEDIKVTK